MDGGIWGDPYENIKIENQRIIFAYYGGSNYRWAYIYTFDAAFDYRLIQVEYTSSSTIDTEITSVLYDVITDEVIETITNGEITNSRQYRKKYHEQIYLMDFNVYESMDWNYN